MKWYNKLAFFCCLLLLVSNCEEVIEFERSGEGGVIVVFGRLTADPETSFVSLGLTSPVELPPQPVSFAEVFVSDEAGNRLPFPESREAGTYRPRDAFPDIRPGARYRVEICIANGDKYQSDWQIMPGSTGTDSVRFAIGTETIITERETELERTVVNIFLDASIESTTANPAFLRWEVEETYAFFEVRPPVNLFPLYQAKTCYITNPVDAQRFFLFNSLELSNRRIENLQLTNRLVDGTFATNHYFTVKRYSMNFETYQYWNKIGQLTARVGSIFDNPPAAVQGNLVSTTDPDKTVFGYFEVVNETQSRVRVTRNDIPTSFSLTCDYNFSDFNGVTINCFTCLEELFDEECLNCLILKNSSTVRPDFF